jgi:FMN phosphatase YigB (HAD superfamily)
MNAETVFLVDVDNTLLDNDRVSADVRDYLTTNFGRDASDRYWQIFEELRSTLGYADYLGALQRYRIEHPREPSLIEISLYLIDYPFVDRLYPRALDVIARLASQGPVVIFSDGDAVFQPRKVARSGLWAAVSGRVLIYVHKETMLADMEARYPASHYVLIDDKLRILSAVKKIWHERVTTVFPRQGHYALDPAAATMYPPADLTVDAIAQLIDMPIEEMSRRR